MASDKFFDFIFLKERGYSKKQPYTVRGFVVLGNPGETSGFSKPYVAVGEKVKTAEEAEFLIKAMERELYSLRKQARNAFDGLAREQKKADEATEEAAALAAKKAAEKEARDAAEAQAKKKADDERAERRRND
jgi:hypothetical protein